MNTMVQSIRDLSQIKIAALIGTAVVLTGFFAFLALRISSPVLAPLYTNVPVEDASKIVAELDQKGIKYELRANGTQILVPSDRVNRLRLQMAEQGLPSSGSILGYELFDKSQPLGTTNFVLNLNQVRALEGELGRTIGSFQQIENARVHLVMPKRELFTREKVQPTASVALKLRGSADLSKEEIASIRHLVATAVPGLKPERITIVDNRGQLLAKGGESTDNMNVYTEEAEGYRIAYENRLRSTVERLLEQSIGAGKVKAEVHAEIDFDRTIRNMEKYDPEGQVVRSVQSVSESEQANEAGGTQEVSVANNLPDAGGAQAGGGPTSTNNRKRSEETTNYEISKEVINSVKETGTVKRLSIAVLVDGAYAAASGNNAPQYAPRSEDELANLERLVKSAIGFNEARGDEVSVVNMQFAANDTDLFEDGKFDWIKNDLNGIIQTLVLGGVAILAILLVIRPLVARAIESAEMAQQEDEIEQIALAAPSIAARLTDQSQTSSYTDDDEADEMINIDRVSGKVKSSSYNKINSMVDKHTDETVQIIRGWILNAS